MLVLDTNDTVIHAKRADIALAIVINLYYECRGTKAPSILYRVLARLFERGGACTISMLAVPVRWAAGTGCGG